MVFTDFPAALEGAEANGHLCFEHQGKGGKWRTEHLRDGAHSRNEEAGVVLDGRIYLAQKKLLPGKMAKPIPGLLGAVNPVQ